MAFARQTWTLFVKNLLIVFWRHPLATIIRALILPIIITAFLSFARNLFVPPANFGIGSPRSIRSLGDALNRGADTGRSVVAFVDASGGDPQVSRVIGNLTSQVEAAGKTARRLSKESDLAVVCKSSLRSVSGCFGAAVFRPPGSGGIFNYSLRFDGSLGGGGRIDANADNNDAQVFTLPFQRAVDAAITGLDSNPGQTPLTANTQEYLYTKFTQEERAERIRIAYQSAITNFMGVAFIAGMIGVAYHLTGFIATEREIGMSTLIESMMASRHPWAAQAARLISYHLAFSVLYLPGWIFASLILRGGVFPNTSALLFIFYHIIAGLALASNSLLGAAFFKKSQLSGVTVTIVFCVLAIMAQAISYPSTATVAVLSLLFAPCNYVYFITNTARWQREQWPTDLLAVPPNSAWNIPAIWLWVFLGIQTLLYPILAGLIERRLYGTGSQGRTIVYNQADSNMPAVQLEGFTKIYAPGFIRRMFSFISKPREPVRAVDGLSLSVGRGQILALLGANGSGKSTTLDAIAGIGKLTGGRITIDGTGGIGICPQKNVLWDDVTVLEHIRIFNRLKSPGKKATKEEIHQLAIEVDLEKKTKAYSKTLSGGQKRKLQLAMMLTGGSRVTACDEVSSGIDPLSRRKIWEILLAERQRGRTIILTTHFLDEADLLADHIAVLSKGTLRAEGSSVELKNRLGGGYRIHFLKTKSLKDGPEVDGVTKKVSFDQISYVAASSALAANVIRTLETHDIRDYRFSGPTIEDVFLQVAEEVKGESALNPSRQATSSAPGSPPEEAVDEKEMELLSGEQVGLIKQAMVLFMKRCIIFKHNWFPSIAAFLIPVLAAGLVTLFIKGQQPVGCSPDSLAGRGGTRNLFADAQNLLLIAGPSSKISAENLLTLFAPLASGAGSGGGGGSNGGSGTSGLIGNINLVDSLDDFNRKISDQRKNVTPAGFWLGDPNSPPTLAYNGIPDTINSFFGQNLLNMLLTNKTLAATYTAFDTPWSPDSGNSLQLLVYVCLALAAYPGFFSLYPNLERRRQVRGLQYSNGVRQFPLWIAYLGFDFSIVLASSALVIILFVATSSLWFHVGYLFLILVLYGLCSILIAYNISIGAKNQLSAYAFTAGYGVLGFLVYLIGYLATLTFAPVNRVDDFIAIVHFAIAAIAPIGSVTKALFVVLNLFSAACDDQQLAPNPGGIQYYGGPILYLIVQAILLFLLLLWIDSGTIKSTFQRIFSRTKKPAATSEPEVSDEEVAAELRRVTSGAASQTGRKGTIDTGDDGLQVVHLTKTFGKNTAVDNVTFGIKRGEVFALLGPNGAGKSTTISMIRGDIQPDRGSGGDVYVEGISVTRRLAAARANLGVCPQFDAIDQMTVLEHLRFYARIRGIPDVNHNVEAILKAVGLEAFRDRQALALSGGNKRKLSLGIALMGNPSVLLSDEMSSGLDAAAKRLVWRTLASVSAGRAILLTTHSMEEADALAGRVGILARRMLAIGTADDLRGRFGNLLHVHIECKGAPHTTDEHVAQIKGWIAHALPGAEVEPKSYHGQIRFSVPASQVHGGEKPPGYAAEDEIRREGQGSSAAGGDSRSAIGQLVVMLEEQKVALGIQHYSVSPTTLDQVFLTIVGKHNVREEGYENDGKEKLPRAIVRNLGEGAYAVADLLKHGGA